MKDYINKDELYSIVDSNHPDPHHFLGQHQLADGTTYINVFQPHAQSVTIIDTETHKEIQMEEVESTKLFTLTLPKPIRYKVLFCNAQGEKWERFDPYTFLPTISDFDCHLFGGGTHYQIFDKLGAHVMEYDGVTGVAFAVWAPNAGRVSVVGDFCGWDGRIFPMRMLGGSGIYELFIPGLDKKERYKFEIKTHSGDIIVKADPYAMYSELRPATASVVWDSSDFVWQDDKWYRHKQSLDNLNQPMAIYELHLGSWKRNNSETGFLNYRQLAHEVAEYVKEMNYTHIELMPIAEHPFDGSWGYQVTGYYAPTSRFGNPNDFMYFVDYLHQAGIGVILDWVPAHFPKDDHGLRRFDGSALYEHLDPKQGEHPHWGTQIFNLGRNEVKNFLIGNAIYWIEKFHIDGLRVDAVASMLYLDYGKEEGEWVPNEFGGRENNEAVEFFRHLNSVLFGRYDRLFMIAEESTAWLGVSRPPETGGLGFNLKWNMGWMNDFLRYIEKDPLHRKYHHNDLTFGMVYAYTENFILVLSHDEVVHGKGAMINKMPGDYWQKFANLRAAYGYMYGHPGKKLLFMGGEFGQFDEWSEAKSLDWHLLEFEKHNQLREYIKDLNAVYKKENALWNDDFTNQGFEWINCTDWEESIVSFVRYGVGDEMVVVISNFTPVPRTMHRVGVPRAGSYQEIFNSDDLKYGGSGIINQQPIKAANVMWDDKPYSIDLKIPPLATIILKYGNGKEKK